MPPAKTAERTNQVAAPQQAPTGNLPAAREAKQKPPIVQFREYVNQRMTTLEEALPPHINPSYFVSAIMVALQKKPSLLKCTFASIWNACVEAAKDGLLPDNKEGAIVPYGENADGKRVSEIATWMPMIEGYRKKIFETGKVRSWEVQVVREKDDFEYELGDNAFIRHKPYVGVQSPGGIVGAYSIAKLESGETVREVMGAYDIMQVASKSRAGNGPWKDPAFVPEMARKVVARRHYKQLPHSRELSAMIERDDERFGIDTNPTEELPPTKPTRRLTSREAFDTYAGATIDQATGEVVDDTVSDADRAEFENEKPNAARAEPVGEGSRGADAATATASAPATSQAPAAGRGAAAVQEAGAQPGTTAPASDAPGPNEAAIVAMELEEEEQIDGADRPWPPGAEPTNEAEFERYLRTELAKITDAAKVAPWWKGQETLRNKCKVTHFKEFQDIAIARRNELAKASVK